MTFFARRFFPFRPSVVLPCASIALAAGAFGCGGGVRTEGTNPRDGGGSEDAAEQRGDTGEHSTSTGTGTATSASSQSSTGVITETCNVVQIVQPILVVTAAGTGAPICDATASATSGFVSLAPCGAAAGCPKTCAYTVGGLEGSSATTITVTAHGYGSTEVSVEDSYCGCKGASCAATVVMASLPHQLVGDAAPLPDASVHPPGAPCPADAPPLDSACSASGSTCEYGTNLNPNCNALFQCNGSEWRALPREGTCPPPGATCPSSYAAASGNLACATDDLQELCEYPQGTCVCTNDSGGLPHSGGPTWDCTPTTSGCPAAVPILGSSCEGPSLDDCDYGQCSGGVGTACVDGYWELAMVACPA